MRKKSTVSNTHCGDCNVRISKNKIVIPCWICSEFKHPRCQGLTRHDANIINNDLKYSWICRQCITEILPINIDSDMKSRGNKVKPSTNTVKQKCSHCSGYSYRTSTITRCNWCEEMNHVKCSVGILGCKTCCNEIIPGFNTNHSSDLFAQFTPSNERIFNPYDREQLINRIGDKIDNSNTMSADQWSIFSDTLLACSYKQQNDVSNPNNNELSVYSNNIRSLIKNMARLREESTDLSNKYDILCFNETGCNIDCLPNGLDDIIIEGFHEPLIMNPVRKSNKGGGLAVYINKRVCASEEFEQLDKPIDQDPTFEAEFQCVRIRNTKCTGKTIILVNTYRSPSRKPTKFVEILDNTLCRLQRYHNKQILLVGDYNIDLMKFETDAIGQSLIETTESKGFVQVISKPTRITDYSMTLIDHVYSNMINKIVSTSVITTDMSDHLATHIVVSLDCNSSTFNATLNQEQIDGAESRIFNAAADQKFKELIDNEQWDIPEGLDADDQYDHFITIYNGHYDSAYPVRKNRQRRRNERLDPKPWILPWLEDACFRKNCMYNEFVKFPTTQNKVRYEKMKAFIQKHISRAKSKYMDQYFKQYSCNSKKQWQMINGLLNRKNNKRGNIKLNDEKGDIIAQPNQVAERFNEYFSKIAANIKKSIADENIENPDPLSHMGSANSSSLFIQPVQPGEVHGIIKNFKNKATLDSKVNPLKIANSSFSFTASLSKIINKSFSEGVFPEKLKNARVVPIHKGGSKLDVKNYRPISLLALFSKIYEKLMHVRVMSFLDSGNLLHEYQYGFRPGRSCEQALLTAQHSILETLSKNKVCLLLLIDFSKAFDLVEYPILLKKLYHYGIRGSALKWFQSYLRNRKQFVSVNGADSSEKNIEYGVPQGSILGPLLFIIYINDLPNISNLAQFILYADDANILISGETIAEVLETLKIVSLSLVSWVKVNGLKLNLKKTHFMIFSKRKVKDTAEIEIDGTTISRSSEACFLGVIMDDKLTWSKHIEAVKLKMARYLGIMYRIRYQLPLKARLQIYHSFVQSHINYCSLVWGFAAKSNIEKLFIAQKKGVRATAPGFMQYFYEDGVLPTHTKSSFKDLKILTVFNLISVNATVFMHRARQFPESLPTSVRSIIDSSAPSDGDEDAYSQSWSSKYGSNIFGKSLCFKGPLLYLPKNRPYIANDTSITSYITYRNKLKTVTLAQQGSGETEEWEPKNNALSQVKGLRSSKRINNTT